MTPSDKVPEGIGPDDFDPEEIEDLQNDGPRYGEVSNLGGMEIPTALQGLTLFRDTYLGMQAFNLAIVDGFLNDLEGQVLRRLFEEERTLSMMRCSSTRNRRCGYSPPMR